MYARVSRYKGDPARLEEVFGAPAPPELNDVPGYLGAWSLIDRESGRAITMTLWESEKAMHDSVTLANRLRSEANEQAGSSEAPIVEMYEVIERPEELSRSRHA